MSIEDDLTIALPVLMVVILPVLLYWRYRTMRSLAGARRWFLLSGVVAEMMALEYVFLAIHILGWVRVSSIAIGVVFAVVFIGSLVLVSLSSDAAAALHSARKDRR